MDDFNPRSPGESDFTTDSESFTLVYFNPRSPGESDEAGTEHKDAFKEISIHALLGRATFVFFKFFQPVIISIHALLGRATR